VPAPTPVSPRQQARDSVEVAEPFDRELLVQPRKPGLVAEELPDRDG
jgi:hypothetical protein